MKAVILAAGIGSRLKAITQAKPKCLVKVAGIPILEHQIRAYLKAGINQIVIVTGYKSNQVYDFCQSKFPENVKLVDNPRYLTTNNMYSLFLTLPMVAGGEFILSNGDVVFEPAIINDLVNSSLPDAIVCDQGSYNPESMKVTVGPGGYINAISKRISEAEAYGNSIDLYKFSEPSASIFFNEISRIISQEGNVNDWVEVALHRVLSQGQLRMQPLDIRGKPWMEIDNLDDLLAADRLFGAGAALKNKKLYLVDLDGTIYLGNDLIPGSTEFVNQLRARGKFVRFISNNSSKSKEDYVRRLNDSGIISNTREIVLSTDGLIAYLKQKAIRAVFLVGTGAMKNMLNQAGIDTESDSAACVVLGYDTELTYAKLKKAALLINSGAVYLATHCDVVCPTPEGPIPDIGSMIELFKAATGKTPHKIFGKPNPEMIDWIFSDLQLSPGEAVLIGDRLYTDMEMARRTGCLFVGVLSGETSRIDIENSDRTPDLIVKNVGELVELIE
jgi:HAD superfamily hydrolase (TIGR01450 family)